MRLVAFANRAHHRRTELNKWSRMGSFKVGKFRISTFSFGSRGPDGLRVHGRWHVYDEATDSGDPVAEGESVEERDNDDAAIADADRDGRCAAEGLTPERRSFGDHGETAG
ncbi:hypothetical protein [Rhodanobacter sp. C05]|uniref:hypothetical protein n=1 Tax=Rhodanobacter sp. C05 TaxID=1945855 RepID=UPI00117A99E7|nr:hypothetical protein [Rhodanobacter sp. C05]